MKKLVSLVSALVMLLSLVPVSGAFAAQEVVNVYNWYDYMDETVFEIFEQETGIHVNKMYFTTNEDMMVQVRVSPGAYDLVFPSDYCVERMIAEDMLAEINMDNIPNIVNIDPNQLNADYDPENKYSVPFMWGTVGILYNTKLVDDPVDSWGILWNDKYADSIFMLDSIRDTLGITLKYLGYSMNTRDVQELKAAADKLKEQKPIVKAYYVDETKDKMVAGEAALAVVYSGDALYAMGATDLARYEEAIAAYRNLPDGNVLSPDRKIEVAFKIGRALEKAGQKREAMDQYYKNVVLAYAEATTKDVFFGTPARTFFARAAFALADYLGGAGNTAAAKHVLERVIAADVPAAEEARRRLAALKGKGGVP